jgi:signal transduction histidine kinase
MNTTQILNVQVLADWLESHQREAALLSVVVAAITAISDWRVGANVSLGALYTFAILISSLTMPRAGIVVFALVCAVLREAFGPFRWQPAYEVRIALVGTVFGGLGLLVAELNRNRKLIIQNLRQREQYLIARRESKRQLGALLDTSPIPILLAEASGTVVVANQACGSLLGISPQHAAGNIFDYLPELRALLDTAPRGSDPVRREIECAGRRGSGELFFAHVWLTAYEASTGTRMAVVLWDASEDLRGREMANVESKMATSRVLLAGFAHEVGNLASAASALCTRLAIRCDAQRDDEYLALTRTLQSLSGLAASGLRLEAGQHDRFVDLSTTMEQIRIVLQPILDGADVEILWDLPERLPRVRADHSALIQVFLNLAINSERATRQMATRQFRVEAVTEGDRATLTVCDNGPGVSDPEHLFEHFHSHAGGAGLGLYVSRATLRSCGGDLWYEPGRGGACFCIRLQAASS